MRPIIPELGSVLSWNIKHGLRQNTTFSSRVQIPIKGPRSRPITFMVTAAKNISEVAISAIQVSMR